MAGDTYYRHVVKAETHPNIPSKEIVTLSCGHVATMAKNVREMDDSFGFDGYYECLRCKSEVDKDVLTEDCRDTNERYLEVVDVLFGKVKEKAEGLSVNVASTKEIDATIGMLSRLHGFEEYLRGEGSDLDVFGPL